jgi:hypothetical protein
LQVQYVGGAGQAAVANVLNEMRKQYFFRPSPGGFFAWDVDKLIELTAEYPRRRVALSEIRELNEAWSGPGEGATWAALVEHIRLVDAADLKFPIILAADGGVMDGMHRVAKALRMGRSHIEAVQFPVDPAPDYRDVQPTDLPYVEKPADRPLQPTSGGKPEVE